MASQNNRQFVIENGPGKFDLATSLFTGTGRRRPNFVEFSLGGVSQPLAVVLTSISQEDGSGESWNFKGITYQYSKLRFSVEGYFSSLKRTGTIRLAIPGDMVPLDCSIGDLDFSAFTYNALGNFGIRTLRDLTQYSAWELLKANKFGPKALGEVKDVLSRMLLSLKNDEFEG